jgi:hypothetical protein
LGLDQSGNIRGARFAKELIRKWRAGTVPAQKTVAPVCRKLLNPKAHPIAPPLLVGSALRSEVVCSSGERAGLQESGLDNGVECGFRIRGSAVPSKRTRKFVECLGSPQTLPLAVVPASFAMPAAELRSLTPKTGVAHC